MEPIKGIEHIKQIYGDFKYSDLIHIISFTYTTDIEDKYNEASLYVDFLLDIKGDLEIKKVTIKFSNVSGFKLSGVGQMLNLSSFEIEDMYYNGWDINQRYIVRDYEDEIFQLKCSSIEVVSVSNLYE